MSQETPPPIGLSPIQEKAAQMIAKGMKKVAVARAVDRNPATISRWLKEPLFQQRLEQLVEDEYRPVKETLRQALPKLVNVVLDIALGNADKESSPTQLKAALWAIDRVWKEPKAPKDSGKKDEDEPEDLPVTSSELAELLLRGRDDSNEQQEGDA